MQARANDYDAIVVGGGHNGLVSGAYFSRAGARTVVLEAREKTGGAADTSAPFADHPEVRVSTYSYVMSLMLDEPGSLGASELPFPGPQLQPSL